MGFRWAGKHWHSEILPVLSLFHVCSPNTFPPSPGYAWDAQWSIQIEEKHVFFSLILKGKKKIKSSSILAEVLSKLQLEADTQHGNFSLNSWRLAKPHLQLKTVESVWQTKWWTLILLYRILLRAKKPFVFFICTDPAIKFLRRDGNSLLSLYCDH